MSEKARLTIVIVSYNTREMTLDCLTSIYAETRETPFHVVVLDNMSNDGSPDAIAEAFPQAQLIRSPKNLGFARGNNAAVSQTESELVLLLNPDTVVLDGAIDTLVAFANDNPRAMIWGGRTLFGDRTLNPSSCWRRMTVWNLFCRST
ncbi:MAG: glycosyltransferase family 2 protein, partial [Hyphomicrobiaceae bacterium]